MTPLNLYLRAASAAAAEQAALDYGQCIRDLAHTNIFPGDLLLKNFGVTRHGRVIFYDYDELCLVTDCHFRDVPQPANPEDEMRGEPWFYVGEHDVFPETFINFVAFDAAQRARAPAHARRRSSPRDSGGRCSGGCWRERCWRSCPTTRTACGSRAAA